MSRGICLLAVSELAVSKSMRGEEFDRNVLAPNAPEQRETTYTHKSRSLRASGVLLISPRSRSSQGVKILLV